MYPTLYHVFLDLFGWELPALKLINSFGLFVALAFATAAATLRREMDRKQKLGVFTPSTLTVRTGGTTSAVEWATQGMLGFLIGWKFIYLVVNSKELFSSGLPQSHLFSLEGSLPLGMVFAGLMIGWKYWETRKTRQQPVKEEKIDLPASQHVGGIVAVAAIGGVAGAKLFHLLEYPDELIRFFTDPSLSNFLGGLTIYGGLIVGGVAVYIYARKNNIHFLHLADSVAPGLMLGYGVGRIGCQVSGDGDWGIPNSNPMPEWLSWLPDWMWSYQFPNNVNGVFGERLAGYTGRLIGPNDPWPSFDGYGTYLDPGVYPTAFYETIMATVIFVLLWKLRKRFRTPGMLFAIYCMLNGLERFFIEKIRVNAVIDFAGLEFTQAELISLATFIGGAFLFWALSKKK
jgi:prolipoprotein diacylglyceryl transferase